MPSDPQTTPLPPRDGTSQAGRILRALDPGYARIDERTTRDLLAFAREYARELKYFGLEDPAKALGDWSGFIGSVDLDAAAAYAREPEKFSPEQAAPYSRPHFALFLAFLEILGEVRGQINELTRRHLEFFYRDILKVVRKRAVPDKVHILLDLESGTSALRLPVRTALRAGKDSLGKDLVYRTDRELIANQVEVAQVSSLRVEMNTIGIKEASRQYLMDGTRDDAFVAMLKIALGQPDPGDPLPVNLDAQPPLYPGVPAASGPNAEIGFDVLVQAQKLIGAVEDGLGMPLFDDFRALMRWKRLRQDNDAQDWKKINSFLEKAGKTRTGDANFKLNPQDPSDFAENLRTVLGITNEDFAKLFDGLPEVKTMEDAYAVYAKRPEDVQPFITSSLYLSSDDFKSMMKTKVLMDNQWVEINRLLGEAGKRDDPSFDPDRVRQARTFDDKLATARPDFKFVGGIDAYHKAFLSVERYFYMSAENFKFIMSVAERQDDSVAGEWDWEKVYEIVSAAHSEMIYARRRDALKAFAQDAIEANDNVKAFRDMLSAMLDEKLSESISVEELKQKLGSLGMAASDYADLVDIVENPTVSPDWSAVARVLEIAQRNREKSEEPVARKIEWRNLYPAVDATAVATQADGEGLQRWKTFGQGERRRKKEPVPDAALGWAMASTLLALSEGERKIDLTLGFSSRPENFDSDEIRTLLAPPDGAASTASFNPFQVQLSTEKGWLEPESVTLSWVDPNMDYPDVEGTDTSGLSALHFSFTLAEDKPSLTSLTSEVHGIDTSAPVLRLMLKPIWNEHAKCYVTSFQVLRNLVLMRANLKVAVTGLGDLVIGNEQSTLDAKKPFEPFGNQPSVGSRFYLGHPEIVAKKLDSVTFNIAWMDVPSDLGDHYKNYKEKKRRADPQVPGNTSFEARVSLVEGNVATKFPKSFGLFDANDAASPVAIKLDPPTDQGSPDSATVVSADVSDWNRYLVWELTPTDFQHSVYPRVALEQSLKMAAAIANKKPDPLVPATYQVNPPYTPKVKSLSVDYSASVELSLDPDVAGEAAARVFQVAPFGYAELKPEGAQPGCQFLPQYDFEGELYIGLRNVRAPQNVSLLFQVAEGSAIPDFSAEPVQWSYLNGNRWVSLQEDGSLLADATRGLINSGIVELSLKPVQANTLLPGDLYWIRAAISRSPDSVCDIVSIHPNAAVATFADDNNSSDHLIAPLPSGSLVGTVTPVPGAARIRQPYSSFGGKMAEQDEGFYARVSERLRHKQRALTAWDYERLVLEKFPRLYKVKCLHVDPVAHPRDPGRVDLVVIPNIRNRLPFNPFEPKAPADMLSDIEIFLQDKIPPFASVRVKNAHYVPVMVRCGVRFVAGSDEGFCKRQLTEELNRFLSPWAYEEGADIVVGGSVYANSIIDFIDRRDYVDYVADFKLFTSEDGENFNLIPPPGADTIEGYHARASKPDGVLVAAREHFFDMISETNYRPDDLTGINFMSIELDFIVS